MKTDITPHSSNPIRRQTQAALLLMVAVTYGSVGMLLSVPMAFELSDNPLCKTGQWRGPICDFGATWSVSTLVSMLIPVLIYIRYEREWLMAGKRARLGVASVVASVVVCFGIWRMMLDLPLFYIGVSLVCMKFIGTIIMGLFLAPVGWMLSAHVLYGHRAFVTLFDDEDHWLHTLNKPLLQTSHRGQVADSSPNQRSDDLAPWGIGLDAQRRHPEGDRVPSTPPPSRTPDARSAYAQGVYLIRMGRWAEADRVLSSIQHHKNLGPEMMACIGWARIHNPRLEQSVRISSGMALLQASHYSKPEDEGIRYYYYEAMRLNP